MMIQFLHPRYWPTWFVLGWMWLAAQLPFRMQMGIGQFIGLILYTFAKDRRHIANVNIKLCFPKLSAKERAALVRANFISTGKGIVETCMAWFTPQKRLDALSMFEGLEHFQEALEQGKGVLALNAHFTSLDIVSRMIAMKAPMYFMYRRHKNALFNYVMMKRRQQHMKDCAVERDDMRRLIRLLKENSIIWYAPDQDYGSKHSVFVNFFGVEAATITATSKITAMTGAKIVAMWCYRRKDGKGYRAVIEPALQGFPTGDDESDAQRINDEVQRAIEYDPTQYLWSHRRFKTQRKGKAYRPY